MLPNLRQGAHFLDAPNPLPLLSGGSLVQLGKLCRNPFSTIKLPDEDGGSKAARRCGNPIILRISGHFEQVFALFLARRCAAV
ncbi:hypothetical protein [Aminobacter sp. HY435]|uniref:hypothetical protein n=1 Tax=Aminobacter sp. HY435 TaxID=2970917 RepID=UPI0022B95D92|nr:hypothetical protein [Aminobacter sp. HY435]